MDKNYPSETKQKDTSKLLFIKFMLTLYYIKEKILQYMKPINKWR